MSVERWTVYVCPNCGKRKAGAYFCRCVVPSSRCQPVEVLPLSDYEVVEAERGSYAFWLGQLVEAVERHCEDFGEPSETADKARQFLQDKAAEENSDGD